MANPCFCCSLATGVKIASILSILCAVVVVGVSARVFHLAYDARYSDWVEMQKKIVDFIFNHTNEPLSVTKGLNILMYTSGVVVVGGALQFFTSLCVLLLSGKSPGGSGRLWVFINTIVAIALFGAFLCVVTTNEYTGYKDSDLLQAFLGVTLLDFFVLLYLLWVHVEFIRASTSVVILRAQTSE